MFFSVSMNKFLRVQVLGEHDDTPTTDDLVEASANQELDKSPSAALRVQEAILKELTNEDVHKVYTHTRTRTHLNKGTHR